MNKYKVVSKLFDSNAIPKESITILENFDQIVQSIRPINSKQLLKLPEDINNLSHQLTDERATRRLGYMNEKVQLSAYVRYFTWWNLVRLTKLFANLPKESFIMEDGICLDAGSGPLSVVIALYLARPELRNLKLTWYCLDISQNSLAFGEDLFLSIAAKIGQDLNWKIIRVKGSFGTSLKQKASFITCANMLNELNQSNKMPPEYQTKKYYEQFKIYANENARFLLIEPGFPKASRTLSLLRTRFIDSKNTICAPCSHLQECPMNGFKAYTGSSHKWCNFAFSTVDAPKKLQILSDKAKLPKERATLSFISVAPFYKQEESDSSKLYVRINSDGFTLPGKKTGFYGCSKLGLTLLSISQTQKIDFSCGDLLQIELTQKEFLTDKKSGAKIIFL